MYKNKKLAVFMLKYHDIFIDILIVPALLAIAITVAFFLLHVTANTIIGIPYILGLTAAMSFIFLIISLSVSRLKRRADMTRRQEKRLFEKEKEKMRTNLLRAVSHDFRTPLTGIIGASSSYLANASALTESEKLSLMKHIYEDSNWLFHMVENLLSITELKSEADGVTKTHEPIEEVLSEAIARFKKWMPNVPVSVTAPSEFLMIPMNAMLIEQAIINLLENAASHSQNMGPIECFVRTEDTQVIFSVKDYGTEIPENALLTIFDDICTSEAHSSDSHKGIGIGLSVCKTIILAHGGEIWAENHEHGVIFSFSLTMG